MCGIAGIRSVNERPVAVHELHGMCSAMVHRSRVFSTAIENQAVREG